ncbi:MAG TPA: substrate-binding domain-containing protein [Acidimicrobiales bacterium]|nr:substrate-binding domain-containing protein [Acidimicrobiales bacterium]
MVDLAEPRRPSLERLRRRCGRWPALVTAALAVTLTPVWAAPAGASPQMNSTGSSFAGVAIQQWVGQAAELYGLNINWQVSNSVQGLDDFAQNEMDFAASDIPYSSGQASGNPTVPFQYMPDVAGALAFMYNLTGNNGQQIRNLVLNQQALEDIFTGRIVYWDDPVIQNVPGQSAQTAANLPHQKILPIYRSDASGENYLFSDYMLHLDAAGFEAYQQAMGFPVGSPSATWPTLPAQVTAPPGYPGWADGDLQGENGSDNAANYVSASSSDGAITYVETAYAKEHDMPVASVENASGNAVQPTSEDDAVALEKAILYSDLTQNLANVYTNPLPTAYPISAYSYFVTPCSPSLASAQHTSCAGNNSASSGFPSQKGQALGQFVEFVACAGQSGMAALGYSPLPPNLVQEDFDAIGRLNGGQEPPPVNSATCKNPYVDGQTPLPGEPAVIGQAPPAGAAANGLGGSSGGPGGGGGADTTSPLGGDSSGGGGGTAGSTSAQAADTGRSSAGSAAAARRQAEIRAIKQEFHNGDQLTGAVDSALRSLPEAARISLWCAVLGLLIAGPPLAARGWRRRRGKAGASPDAARGEAGFGPPGPAGPVTAP